MNTSSLIEGGSLNAETAFNGIESGYSSFTLAPGAERHSMVLSSSPEKITPMTSAVDLSSHSDQTKIMDYSTDFPKLPDHYPSQPVAPATRSWGKQPSIQSTILTEAFKLAPNERACRNKSFGNSNDEQQKCNQVAQNTGTKIELFEAKDQSLTILITGKRQNVAEARAELMRELRTQASIELSVPKEYHGYIIGKDGTKLRALEHDFFCRIIMPGKDEKGNNTIRIIGPNEHIIEAANRIQNISDDMAKQGREDILIPKQFYPWVRGPFNETMESIIARTGVKIDIPPSSKNEPISVRGEKPGVEIAAAEIRSIYENLKDVMSSMTYNLPKKQHRYIVRRSGIDEILRDTSVCVELPPEDDDSDLITLRGPRENIRIALQIVIEKALSTISQEINYAEWMRRFLIGPKGSTLQSIVPNYEKLKVDFEDAVIVIEGPADAVTQARAALAEEISRLDKEMKSEVIHVSRNLHRHIIGKSGSQVNKIKEEHGVQITVPDEASNSDEIRIEGKKEGVEGAKKAIAEIVNRLENEKSRDIIIPQRFHGQIIGKSGENTQKWRKEYPSVNIAFPSQTEKSDIVNLRGNKQEVDKIYTILTKQVKELELSNYQDSISIFKDYYKHIIGKNGSQINKIRDETKTRIELPSSGDGRITVIGKQEDVEKAIERLHKIQNELASVVAVEVDVPKRLYPRLLSGNRGLLRDLENEFGGVHIIFPKEKDNSSKVIVRGPKNDVVKAEVALKELVKNIEQMTDEISIEAKPEYIKFLIGTEGSKVKKLREKFKSVRIIFPSESDKHSNIVLIGKKDEVEAVRKIYHQQITEMNETIEIKMDVEQKYHKHFINRGAELLREIQSHNGNCLISFPRRESNETKVTVKGSKNCVESAKVRIEEIVSDLAAQVTINLDIPEEHHRSLVSHLNNLETEFNVKIQLPGRGSGSISGQPADLPHHPDLIQISGRKEKCEAVKLKLIDLVPITKTITVPIDYHPNFIGRGGESIRTLMTTHAVRIKIPPQSEKSEHISVFGIKENVEACLAEIQEKVAELDRQAEDRRLRSFKVTLNVPTKYHQKLVGPAGANVRDISARHGVQISVPRSETKSDVITIVGYEENCNKCAEEIQKTIDEFESMFCSEVDLDGRFHPKLLGPRGRFLRKIETDYDVEIQMPTRSSPNPERVIIYGKNEDKVYDCIDKLRAMEEDHINDLIDRGQYRPKHEETKIETPLSQKVQITGAPWQLDSPEEFPAMGAPMIARQGAVNGHPIPQPAWGNQRR